MSPRVGPASLPPTPRMLLIAETIERLGSQRAAAEALGLSAGGISSTMAAYRARTGTPMRRRPPRDVVDVVDRELHTRMSRAPGRPRVGHAPPPVPPVLSRLDEIEQAVTALAGQASDIANQVEIVLAETRAIARTLVDLLHRQPLILEVRPSQRRKADGGMGGAQESRRVRRVVG